MTHTGTTALQMVGRTDEFTRLADALHAGERGEARAILVRGEAGIGKTRIVHEALRSLAHSDGQMTRVIAITHCIDLGPLGTTFAPVRRLLHDVHASVGNDDFAAAAGTPTVLAAIGAVVPEIADEHPTALPHRDASYVHEAIERVIENLSRDRHIVLIVEDIHWADAATLALLRAMAATLRGTHLTVIMTYRTDDVGRDHPMREGLAEFERSRVVESLEITRLPRDDVANQAAQILGREPTASELDLLVSRSEGVPFLVEELLGIAEHDLPANLRNVVLARFERLDPTAQRVVRLASVAGTRVAHDTLAEAWSGSAADLSTGLRAAVSDNVLVADDAGYAFRHALIREAVYADLLPHERSDSHRVLAGILQDRIDAGDRAAAAPAASHWLAALETERAFDATIIAIRHARDGYAFDSAGQLGERLIDLWPLVADAETRAGDERSAVRSAVANDFRAAHRVRDCLRVVDDALRAAPLGDADTRVPLLLMAIEVGTETERRVDVTRQLDEVDALLDGRSDAVGMLQRARSLARRAAAASGAERDQFAEESVRLARASGDKDTLAMALRCRSSAHSAAGHTDEQLTDLRDSLELTPEFGDARMATYNQLVFECLDMGRFDDAITFGSACWDEAVQAGLERVAAPVLSNIAEALVNSGRVNDGIDAARRAVRLLRGDSVQFVLNAVQIEAIATLWDDRLADFDALLDHERSVSATSALDTLWLAVWNTLDVDAAVARAADARPTERASILDSAIGALDPLKDDAAAGSPATVEPLVGSAAALLAAMTRWGNGAPAELIDLTADLASRLTGAPWFEARKAIVDAYLAEARGDSDTEKRWRHAAAAVDVGNLPRRLVHLARYELARLLGDAGEKDEATKLLRRVILESSRDGVRLVARWAREALTRLGANSTPTSGPLEGLTPRELEVLALVAEGRTNRDIGTRLFISPKTASVHVSAILAKLGASNRTEAATLYTTRLARDPD